MDQLTEFAVNHWILVSAFFVVLGLLIANLVSGVRGVQPQDAVRLINHDGAVTIDIRSKADYEAGHIIGALHVPAAEITQSIDRLRKHKDKPIIVYCGTGTLAGQTVRQLRQAGFERAQVLKGGLGAWRNENLPVRAA